MPAFVAAFMPTLNELPWYVQTASASLVVLLLSFLAFFLVPALSVGRQLRRVLKQAAGVEKNSDLGTIFGPYPRLNHSWTEFRETLHQERVHNPKTGAMEVVALRATVSAANFFTEDAVVNTPVRAEFFKHLPGIFTGIGIIGTFTGLLVHLQAFHVTEDAITVRQSLEQLLNGVHEAFIVSALAILLAMLVTLVEKLLLVRLYAKVERLTQLIDERYAAGVGEEYLSRLVGAAEESASQSKILKDSLVGDLKTILTELSERQIAAFGQSQAQLGAHIGESVATQLKGPLERLAAVSESVRGDQGAAVQQLVADLLAQFSAKLEGLFGTQITGIQSMQQQTIEALRVAVEQLQKMSNTVEGAGQKAADTLLERLDETLHKLDQRQLIMSEEMRKFVHEIRTLVGQSQSESHAQLQKLLGDLAQQTTALIGDLTHRSGAAVGAMGTQVQDLSGKVGDAVGQMSNAIGRLESVVTDAITRMNSGAEMLALASEDFARAGQGVNGVLTQAQGLTGQLTQSAASLTAASASLETLLADYRATRDSVGQMLTTVKATVEAAKREASLTVDVLQRLDGSASRLAVAQKAADDYLDSVTQVLARAHQSFADSVSRTLNAGNKEFHDAMSSATKMLRETITELDSVLANAAPRTISRAR
jgi:ABC-type transporter Mla subunit MlaD